MRRKSSSVLKVRGAYSLIEVLVALSVFSMTVVLSVSLFRMYHDFLAEKTPLDEEKIVLFSTLTEKNLPVIRGARALSQNSVEINFYDGCSLLVEEKEGKVEITYGEGCKRIYPFSSFKVKSFAVSPENNGFVEVEISPPNGGKKEVVFLRSED